MSAIRHTPWPKIARLNRTVTVTEKVDGTNAAVGIVPLDTLTAPYVNVLAIVDMVDPLDAGKLFAVYAQSRTRLITPQADNFGFASWVAENAAELARTLGQGLHFGEWAGRGIQRGYGLTERRFYLFSVAKMDAVYGEHSEAPEELHVVPLLYRGPFDIERIEAELQGLRELGTNLNDGFVGEAEGIVIYHEQARTGFKWLLENDALSKTEVAEIESVLADLRG